MSGSFEQLDVPPTLVSFAVTTGKAGEIVSPELKEAGNTLILLRTERDGNGLPETESLLKNMNRVTELLRSGRAVSCYTPGMGGIAEALMKMSFGNDLGVRLEDAVTLEDLLEVRCGDFLLEVKDTGEKTAVNETVIGRVTEEKAFAWRDEEISLEELKGIWEGRLESVYPCNIRTPEGKVKKVTHRAESRPSQAVRTAKPVVLIPAFPGTNCEYDSARAVRDAGAEPRILVIRNRTPEAIARSVEVFAEEMKKAQAIFIPGGFSGGDEPDGSAKFITAFFRNAAIRENVAELLEKRDGLMLGICNGFQALIKLGLLPWGKITDADENSPTLTFNTIARHQSRLVRTRIASNLSPWLQGTEVGEIYTVPVSHGEGRFLAEESLIRQMAERGQIATQYVDLNGEPTMDVRFNPNGSRWAIEGITSPDGRVFGKMGHSERVGSNLYRNVPGRYEMKLFESAVKYFR